LLGAIALIFLVSALSALMILVPWQGALLWVLYLLSVGSVFIAVALTIAAQRTDPPISAPTAGCVGGRETAVGAVYGRSYLLSHSFYLIPPALFQMAEKPFYITGDFNNDKVCKPIGCSVCRCGDHNSINCC